MCRTLINAVECYVHNTDQETRHIQAAIGKNEQLLAGIGSQQQQASELTPRLQPKQSNNVAGPQVAGTVSDSEIATPMNMAREAIWPRVLSLDSGGVGILPTLFILEHLMRRVALERGQIEPIRPCQIFDLIGGTGLGGLVAIMLGRLRMSVHDCIEEYLKLFRSFIPPRGAQRITNFFRDETKALEGALRELVSQRESNVDAQLIATDVSCRVYASCPTILDSADNVQLHICYKHRKLEQNGPTVIPVTTYRAGYKRVHYLGRSTRYNRSSNVLQACFGVFHYSDIF